jgi:tRNA pseudouridine55 synthase
MLGFLNLNKPTGYTSHDCVAKIRRLLKIKKVGHGGTLDPAATGVLPIAVGKATRLLAFLPTNKVYRARIRLGLSTSTDDLSGEVLQSQPASYLTLEDIYPLLPQFEGKIEQIPPAYSAIQVGGKRLYELARKGEKIDVPVRAVEVDRLDILNWYPGEFPELEVEIYCGAGTYIRSIARDLGIALKVGGTLAALQRLESGGMKLFNSLSFEQIEEQLQQGNFSLIPPTIALKHLCAVTFPLTDAKHWCQGQKIIVSQINEIDEGQIFSSFFLRVYQEDGQFLGIGELVTSDNQKLVIPKIVLQA